MEASVEGSCPPSLLGSYQPKGPRWGFSKQQWISLVLLSLGNLGLATCSALQAPFFPREAELKGATPSEYGLVFGLFYLSSFIFSPIFGKLMSLTGPDQLRDLGMFVVGVCFILFGFLDRSPPGLTFLMLAYVVRIAEGIGCAAYKTSNFVIIASTFPNHMASAMGVIETMFGIGLIIGPTAGGVLYEVGGYTLPFVLSGTILVLIALITVLVTPSTEMVIREKKSQNMLRFIMNPLVILYICLMTTGCIMIGFNQVTLEPELRQFNLSPVEVGLVFILGGGLYGITSFIWGALIDRKFNPTVLACVSAMFLGISFTFIGPAPILPINSYLWLVGVSLMFLGCGYGATRVIPFVDCLRHGITRGFENNMDTHGMISGIFNGTCGIGFFLGPTLGGICVDKFGYKYSTFSLALLAFFWGVCLISYVVFEARKGQNLTEAEKPLLSSDFHKSNSFSTNTIFQDHRKTKCPA